MPREVGGGGRGEMGGILLQSPGEIKRREVSWTLTRKSDASAGPGEIKRREVVLDPQVRPEEIKGREVELGLRVGLLLLQLFPNGGATDIVFVTVLHSSWDSNSMRGTVVDEQRRADTALTFRCSGGGPRQPVSRPHSSFPLTPLVPVPNKPTVSVDVKQHYQFPSFLRMHLWWSLCSFYLLACQARDTVDNSGLCYVPVTTFGR